MHLRIGHGVGPRATRSYDDSLLFIGRLRAMVQPDILIGVIKNRDPRFAHEFKETL